MKPTALVLTLALAGTACATDDDANWVRTDFGDGLRARSRAAGDAIETEIWRSSPDSELVATMWIEEGAAQWTDADGQVRDIEVGIESPDPKALAETIDPSRLVVGALPGTELEANELAHALATPPPATDANIAYADCEAHFYDDMTCVVCYENDADGSTFRCYTCVWEDPSGWPRWYGQCDG